MDKGSGEVRTQIDEMLAIIQKNRGITLSNLAKNLGTKREVIKEWGKILEENDYIMTRYSVVGEIEYFPKKR